MNRVLAYILCLLLLTSVLCCSSCRREDDHASANGARLVRVQFGWLPDSHHAGFWLARDKGYYKAEGLSVELRAGGLDSSPQTAVVSGAADIGQAGGLEQLITARAEGLPVQAIAAFHRTSPQALISLNSNPVRSASDLRGKTIAVAYGDAAELLFREFISRNGIAEKELHLVPFRFDLTPLMNHKVDVITGFSTDQPSTLKVKGFSPVVLRYADVGIESYGYTFFCSEQYIARNHDVIDAFLRASRRGWEYAFSHKSEAIALMLAHFPHLDPSAEDTKFESVRQLMCDKNGQLSEWTLDVGLVRDAARRLQQYASLKKEVPPNTVVAKRAVQR